MSLSNILKDKTYKAFIDALEVNTINGNPVLGDVVYTTGAQNVQDKTMFNMKVGDNQIKSSGGENLISYNPTTLSIMSGTNTPVGNNNVLSSVLLGSNSGNSLTSGSENIGIGYNTLAKEQLGAQNVC